MMFLNCELSKTRHGSNFMGSEFVVANLKIGDEDLDLPGDEFVRLQSIDPVNSHCFAFHCLSCQLSCGWTWKTAKGCWLKHCLHHWVPICSQNWTCPKHQQEGREKAGIGTHHQWSPVRAGCSRQGTFWRRTMLQGSLIWLFMFATSDLSGTLFDLIKIFGFPLSLLL